MTIAYKKLTTEQRLRAKNDLLTERVEDQQRKIEFLEEELRIERETQRALARRASYGTGYQQ